MSLKSEFENIYELSSEAFADAFGIDTEGYDQSEFFADGFAKYYSGYSHQMEKEYPELCRQTDDDGQGGLWFEIAKERISIRLTAPYSQERREAASKLAKENNTFRDLH